MKSEKSMLKNQIIYEIYVRNHGPNGTFWDVTQDLSRIKDLGVDIIWLMPIHPIGKKNKKGSLGCPYAIADYRKVNPEYGTLSDFQKLLKEAHKIGLKVMIDVVYNHTAHDSVLVANHPDWFHQDENKIPVTTVPAWSDVIDLKHPTEALTNDLIDTLCYWVDLGVDGFRCDVASILPLDFWLRAKESVEAINPDVIWLAESVHAAFVIERRAAGLIAHSDSELYQAFDLTYDYDIWPIWQAAVRREVPVKRYLEMLMFQRGIYPQGFVKMRCVENHDQPRIMALAPDRLSALAWTAFEIFNEGAFLMYAGQEKSADHTPSLFDVDKVNWKMDDLSEWFKNLIALKKSPTFRKGELNFFQSEPAIQAIWENGNRILFGIFNVNSHEGDIVCPLPNGRYWDLISGIEFTLKDHRTDISNVPAMVFELEKSPDIPPLDYPLLSFIIQ